MDKKIIYVIDSEDTCELLKFVLDKQGYNVIGSTLSEDFFNNFKNDINTCILLDIKMPFMEELDTREKFKERGILSPMIYMFGRTDMGYVAKGFRSREALNFIEKPFKMDEILSAINYALESNLKELELTNKIISIESILDKLTDKQKEVLSYLSLGYSHKKIAKLMDISFRTVAAHLATIKNKSQLPISELIPEIIHYNFYKSNSVV